MQSFFSVRTSKQTKFFQIRLKALENLDGLPASQPANLVRDPLALEVLLQFLPKLREMAPGLVVHRHKNVRFNFAEQARSRLAVHGDLVFRAVGVVQISQNVSVSEVQYGSCDVVLGRHAREFGDVNRVAGEVNGIWQAAAAGAEVWGGDEEAGAFLAVDVFRWGGDDFELFACDGDFHFLPGLEAVDRWAGREVLCAVHGGEDAAAVEQLSAQRIEVVFVVFMAEKDGVDDWELVKAKGWVFADGQGEVVCYWE